MSQELVCCFLAEHYPWASPAVVANMTFAQQEMYIRVALKQGPDARAIRCESLAEAQATIARLQGRKGKS